MGVRKYPTPAHEGFFKDILAPEYLETVHRCVLSAVGPLADAPTLTTSEV